MKSRREDYSKSKGFVRTMSRVRFTSSAPKNALHILQGIFCMCFDLNRIWSIAPIITNIIELTIQKLTDKAVVVHLKNGERMLFASKH